MGSEVRFRPLLDYGVAALATSLAMALQFMLVPWFGGDPNSSPFMMFFAAVLVASWFGGMWPGLFATALSAVLASYFFLSPQYSLQIASLPQGLRLAVFVLEGVLISTLVEMMHSARRRAEVYARDVETGERKLAARKREQQAVAELGQRALARVDLTALMTEAVEWGARILDVEYCAVLEGPLGSEELRMRAGMGWREGFVGQATVIVDPDSQLKPKPVIVEDMRVITRFSNPALLREHEVASGISVGISPGGRFFGVLGAFSAERRKFTEDDVNFLRTVANVLAAAIERSQIEESLRFLTKAGEVLSSSLDYRTTLASVAHLSVPTLADWCAVDIVGDDGSIVRLAVEHPDPEKIELAYRLEERYPSDPDAPGGVHQAIRTGQPQMISEIPAELVDQAAHDEQHREMLRKLGLRSYMVVPLVARAKTLGAITFVTAESGRIYREADLELAQELAHRAALAVDNAWLYEEAQKEIAERRWAQEELRGSRDQLEIILGGVADGITAQDGSGRLFYANAAAARMCGFSSVREFVEAPVEEVLSKFEILDEAGEPFMIERLPGRRTLRGEEEAEAMLRFRILETGEERWTMVRAAPVFGEEGRIRMAVNIMRDMTEQRRSQQERARLAAIVESSDDAIISKTLEGIITSWNRGAERIYGYSPEEAVGQPISMLVPSERPNEIPRILERLRRGEKIEHYETIRLRKDGRRLDISLTISPISDSAGNITGASTIARDITERKRTENALREIREAERRRLARDLHDGPLQDLAYTAAAMGLMMLNAQNTGLENELQAVVDAVRRAARGLRDVVNDLRLEQDRPLPELVESLVKMNQVMARDREISLEVAEDFPSTPLGETGTQMLRIIQEALTNTRRHSEASRVLVNLRSEGRDLIVEVSDDGQGFGPTIPSGVGLSSMRERTAVLDGELEIESEIGHGTRVRLRVPSPQEG